MRKLLTKRGMYLTAWLSTGLIIASNYNACGQVTFQRTQSSLLVDMKSSAVIVINRDEQFSNSDQVELGLDANYATEVFVSNNSDCSVGSWQPFVKQLPWTLASKNQQVSVFAKFRNADEGLLTDCISDSIIHDDEDPAVVLALPVMTTNIQSPIVNFVAGDTLSGLDKMMCEWPGKAPELCRFSTENGVLAENRYLVKISATDFAGNISDPVVQDLVVDRTPPVITILASPPVMGNSQAVNYSFNVTDDRAGVKTIECAFDNKASYASCASPLASNLSEGSHKLYIRATDNATNVSEIEHAFVIDLSAPTVTITASPGDFEKVATARFEFVGRDGNVDITRFECRIDNAAYASCSSPKNFSGLSEGLHKFEVVGYDAVGNRSAPATRSWYVDTMAPTFAFLQEPDALSNKTSALYKYSVSDSGSGVAKVQCSLDGAAFADCNVDQMAYSNLLAGNHTFRLRGIDKAGNSADSVIKSFVIDLTAPAVQLTRVPANFIKDSSFNYGFAATDDRGVARVECKIDTMAYAPCASMSAHLVSALSEGGHRFSVRAVDQAGNNSAEVTDDFTVDLTKPLISYFQNLPAASIYGSVVSLGFNVTDALSGVKSVTCTIDGSATACQSGVVKNLTGLAVGDHSFVVRAEDNAGNVEVDTRTVRISAPALKTQLVDVKSYNKVDILVVIDNSGSMAPEQANMNARFGNFLDKIKNLDYQIGIITTDVSANAALKDGRLVPMTVPAGVNFPANQYMITSATPQATAQAVFGATIKRSESGSGAELGFKASYRALERSRDGVAVSAPNAALFRNDAALAILVVSDAYDTSTTTGDMLVNLVKSMWAQKTFVFHSIVVPESIYTGTTNNAADPCKNYRESSAYDGRNYHALSAKTGGIKGTVCSEDFSGQLADMGKVTADLVNSITLNCQPIDVNGDGLVNMADVTVTSQAGAAITGFTVDGTKLNFGQTLPIGNNEVKYYCVQ